MSRAPLRLLPALALCAGLCASPAGAEELGQVRFTFDGAEKTWYTVLRTIKGKARPSASLKESRMTTRVAIDAWADPDAAPSPESVTITLIYVHAPAASGPIDYRHPANRKIEWVLEGFSGPRWIARGIKLEIETADLAGATGRLAGTFSAEFCHATGISDKPDEASCRPVSGTIDTKVVRKD